MLADKGGEGRYSKCTVRIKQKVQLKQHKNEYLNSMIRARQQESLLRGPSPMYLEWESLQI